MQQVSMYRDLLDMGHEYSILIENRLMPVCHALFEADLSKNEIRSVFQTASDMRNKNAKGAITKAKEIPQQLARIKQKAEQDPRTEQLMKAINAGGAQAKSARDKIDQAVDTMISGASSKLKGGDPEANSKIVSTMQQWGKLAKENPKTAGFILAAIPAIATMASGGLLAGPVLGIALRGVTELAKGEKFSTAVGKGIKTAALGTTIGAAADMGADELAKAIADGATPDVDVPELEIKGSVASASANVTIDGQIVASTDLVLTDPDDIAEWKQINNISDAGEKAIAIEKFEDTIEAKTDQETLRRQFDSDQDARDNYKSDARARAGEVSDTAQKIAPGVKGAGAAAGVTGGLAGSGVADARAKRRARRESTELNRMRELAGLVDINEGPRDWAKSAGKKLANTDIAKNSGLVDKKEINYEDDLFAAWETAGGPTDVESIKQILKKAGFTDREINKTFDNLSIDAESGSDEKITTLVNNIIKNGYQAEILDWLNKNLKESILYERSMSNREIKDIFQQAIQMLPDREITDADYKNDDTEEESDEEVTDNDYPSPPQMSTPGQPNSDAQRETIDFRNRDSLYEMFKRILTPPRKRKI